MPFTLNQRNFAGGEISPSLWGRGNELVKYATGARQVRNFTITKDGSLRNDPGTELGHELSSPLKPGRLFPFKFSESQALVLVFGDKTVQFIQDNAPVLETAIPITGVDIANPCVIHAVHNYQAGDQIIVKTPFGADELNGRSFLVANPQSGTFELQYLNGTAVDATGFNAWISGGTVARVYTVATPYAAEDLRLLKANQSFDVVFLHHPNYPSPASLSRYGQTNWVYQVETFLPSQASLVSTLQSTNPPAGQQNAQYLVTTVNAATGEESFPGTASGVTSSFKLNQVVSAGTTVTCRSTTNHGLTTGDTVFFTVDLAPEKVMIRRVDLANGTATITTQTNHGYASGESVQFNRDVVFQGQTYLVKGTVYVLTVTAVNQFTVAVIPAGSGTPVAHGLICQIFLANPNLDLLKSTAYTVTVVDATHFTVVGLYSLTGNLAASSGRVITVNAVANPNAITLTAISLADPCQLTTGAAHGLASGDVVQVTGTGIKQLDGRAFIIFVLDTTNFTLVGIDATSFDPWPAPQAGNVQPCNLKVTNVAQPTLDAPIPLSWDAVVPQGQGFYFKVYKSLEGFWFGLIGFTYDNTFKDVGLPPDIEKQPPLRQAYFPTPDTYSACGAVFQDRLFLGRGPNYWASQPGFLRNFNYRNPLLASDGFYSQEDANEVLEFRHFLKAHSLMAFTNTNVSLLLADNGGGISANDHTLNTQLFVGADHARPVQAHKNVVFIQANGRIVRDIQILNNLYGSYVGGSDDLTNAASHLTDKYPLTAMDFQRLKDSIIWTIRQDGVAPALTYIKEQQIEGWHRHDTLGAWEDVCVIPENGLDRVYFLGSRQIVNPQGVKETRGYVERLSNRDFTDLKDANFTHSALQYDGRNTDDSLVLSLSGGTLWDGSEDLTLTSPSDLFSPNTVDDRFLLTAADGSIVTAQVKALVDLKTVTVNVDKVVPADLRNAGGTFTWSRAVKKVGGLWHLEGRTLAVRADGAVMISPNNPDNENPPDFVVGGRLNLPDYGVVIWAGLPYVSDLETLDVDVPQSETLLDKRVIIHKVTAFVRDSQAFFAGPKQPDADNDTDGLEEVKLRENEPMGSPIDPFTGPVSVNIRAEWNTSGRFFLRVVDPVPVEICNLLPQVTAQK